MAMKRVGWATLVGAVLLLPRAGAAEDIVWRPAGPAPPPPPPPSAAAESAAPPVTLGRPEPLDPAPAESPVVPVGYQDPLAGITTAAASPLARGEAPDAVPPPTIGPPPLPPPGVGPDTPYNAGVALDRPINHSWWDRCQGYFHKLCDADSCSNRCLFQSDHAFDCLASPITNPFFFEDPRALTEVKPLFFYQAAPSGNPIFRGGNSEFFGTQARLAFTDRLSVVINELGLVSLNPNNPVPGFGKDTGFAQFNIGPKYTFLRSPNTGTVAATGLTFEAPVGSARVFQNTGTLGLDPYVTAAQIFRLPAGFGGLNLMGATGYNFGTDNRRSQFYHASLHLDYNIANTNRFYPMLEMHYFHYTRAGRNTDLGFEGVDLVNFGSYHLGQRDYLSIAPGFRWKIGGKETIQWGIATEWPLLRQKEITDFRLTTDLILRY